MSKKVKRVNKPVLVLIGFLLLIGTLIGVNLGLDLETSVKTVLIIAIVFAVLLGLLLGILNLPAVKGKRGERKVSRVLNKVVKAKDGYVINDVIIPDANSDKTSQIDHIIFLKEGIFSIETKNYAGRIYGSSSQENWTQVLAYGKTKNKLYNPILQNKTHIVRLQKLLNTKDVYGAVVFVRGNTEYIDANGVYSPRQLKKFLKSQNNSVAFLPKELERLYHEIKKYKDNPIQTNKEHIKEVKKVQSDKDNNLCPYCGNKLVLRHSKSGSDFYGCSNYPKCKFTRRLSNHAYIRGK